MNTTNVGLFLDIDFKRQQLKKLCDYFLTRDFRGHRSYGSEQVLCWNIKVYKDDRSGKTGTHRIHNKWDMLWEEYLNQNDGLFWRWCEDGLQFVGNKKTRGCDFHEGIPEIEKCDYILWQEGRGGGWLVLNEFDGYEYTRGKFEEFDNLVEDYTFTCKYESDLDGKGCPVDGICINCVLQMDNYDLDGYLGELIDAIGKLIDLKLFCDLLDKFNASKEWNHQCNYHRHQQEQEWESGNFDCFEDCQLEEYLEKDLPKTVKSKIRKYLKSTQYKGVEL